MGLKIKVNTAVRYNHDRFLKKILPGYIQEGINVLNVGAGPKSPYTEYFSNTNYETLDITSAGRPTHQMDITKQIPNKKYDLVVTFQTLEHIPEPEAAIRNMRKLLKPDGVLFGTVPFMYPIHTDEDYYRYSELGLTYMLGKRFGKIMVIPYGNSILSFLRFIAPIPGVGIWFNIFAKQIEFVFRHASRKTPSGYFFICKGGK